MTTIRWTPEMLARFKREYAKHPDLPDATFTFDGNEYLVRYAKYLIEYLEMQFNPKARQK